MKTYYWLNLNRLISHLGRSFLALAIAGASLTLSTAHVSASRPGIITGGFSPCFNPAGPPRQVGDNTIVTFNVTVDATGSFTGQLEGTELDVIHPDGSITLFGVGLFTGSLNGGPSGTLVFTWTGIGNLNTGHETLNLVGGDGTDGLAGLYTWATAIGNLCQPGQPGCPGGDCAVAGAGTYTGHVVSRPR